ncbi:MAG: hybrid sensor histidine kinase/response regulator [Bacteroidota bacterium]
MTKSLREELLASFAEESTELFNQIMLKLSVMEQQEEPVEQVLSFIRQQLHTLKGAASAVNNATVKLGCHLLEESLDQLIAETEDVSNQQLWSDLLAESIPLLEQWSSNPQQADHQLFVQQVRETWKQGALDPGEEVLALMDSIMALDDREDDAEEAAQADTRQVDVADHAESTNGTSVPETKQSSTGHSIRVNTDRLAELDTQFAELHLSTLVHEECATELKALRDQIGDLVQDWRSLRQQEMDNPQGGSTELIGEKLSQYDRRLKNLYSDIYRVAGKANALNGRLDVQTEGLRDSLQSIRMMPIKPFLESFQRIVFEASRELNKKVRLIIEEQGAEADRTILDKLRDPLIHLVKNAVAHGIESPEVREQVGKDPQGEIVIEAEVRGEMLLMRVLDDGAGVDRQAMTQKAKQQGWSNGQEELSFDQMLDLMCQSGFSTTQNVTEVSGRGMGMDIVRDRIQAMRGALTLRSIDGQGTAFTIQVPTQLSTLQGVSVQAGEHAFGIPQENINRILRLTGNEIRTINDKEIISWEDETIAVVQLRSLLGLAEQQITDEIRFLMLIGYGDRQMALEVDEIITEVPFYLRPLGRQFDRVGYLAGGALMSDGSVLPVLDIAHLFEMVRDGLGSVQTTTKTSNGQDMQRLSQFAETQEKTLVLVVDDSITMRTLEQNILLSNGYDVVVAKHGREALSMLREYEEVGLVISDVEMPHMNGLELCRAIRSGDHSDLPVILVTSLGSDEEKKAGMQAGADAYIVKGDFRQEHFLKTIEQHI